MGYTRDPLRGCRLRTFGYSYLDSRGPMDPKRTAQLRQQRSLCDILVVSGIAQSHLLCGANSSGHLLADSTAAESHLRLVGRLEHPSHRTRPSQPLSGALLSLLWSYATLSKSLAFKIGDYNTGDRVAAMGYRSYHQLHQRERHGAIEPLRTRGDTGVCALGQ